jgi:streptogramin lyase
VSVNWSLPPRQVKAHATCGLLLLALVLGACGDSEPPDGGSDETLLPVQVDGVVQKGPFVRGTTVTVQELDRGLTPTGHTFDIATTDDLGGFKIPVRLSSRFIEVIATGYYYNELRDELSPAPLSLRAIADVRASGRVHVNLLTSIAAPLIRDQVVRGRTFADATSQAESAVLDAIGISRQGASSFDKLDVAADGNENAVLLAASLVIEKYAASLGESEVGELAQLLSQIGAALATGGSATALDKLRAARCATVGTIDSAAVRANLTAHYAAFGVTVHVPPFEPFIGDTAHCPDAGRDASVPPDGGPDALAPTDASTSPDVSTPSDARDVVEPEAGACQPFAGDGGSDGGTIVELSPPSQPSGPGVIVKLAAAAAGDVWYTNRGNRKIGHIPATGPILEFPVPALPSTSLEGIALGADGNVWFADLGAGRIGRITSAYDITMFDVPTPSSGPIGIAGGPDGNVWFTETYANQIGRIDPAGHIVEFRIPTVGSRPLGIASGPDGNVWFTESDETANQIGRVTPSGSIVEFPVPTARSGLTFIVAGADGRLWFGEAGANQIGRISLSGVVDEFPIPTGNSSPQAMTLGPDCNVWFVGYNSNKLGRVTPSGVVTEVTIPQPSAYPQGIAADSNHNIWFTEFSMIGRLSF